MKKKKEAKKEEKRTGQSSISRFCRSKMSRNKGISLCLDCLTLMLRIRKLSVSFKYGNMLIVNFLNI